ncbi:hypothetical protein LRX75_13760 [Rhizobium sp. DKSPLA3]|uniref:DUF4760 domain-containing protein n=1 Tax=Rhizobium quercicola TaxID=2901226 RepID=A0A9X1NUT7_9HYPH|nr:hypothetical protein [Rhizobium quercicola]MCD7110104.1 hypothetical protein [Rhizobium quercicola]
MTDLINKPEWLALLGIFLSAIVGAIAYLFQKRADLKNHLQEIRRREYANYFGSLANKLHYQTISANNETEKLEYNKKHIDALGEMRRSYFVISVISSDAVCRNLFELQTCISAEESGRKENQVGIALAHLLKAIRNEGYGKSRLSIEEISYALATKI